MTPSAVRIAESQPSPVRVLFQRISLAAQSLLAMRIAGLTRFVTFVMTPYVIVIVAEDG